MAMAEAFDTLTPPVRILATDIDTQVLGVAQAGVVSRRVEEADARLVQRGARHVGGNVDVDAQMFEHVGGAAARGDRPVAVLGDG